MTSDDLDLRKGHLGLRTMLRYVTEPNDVDSSAAYAFILGILRRKGNKWKMSNILCLTWPVTSQVTSTSNFETLSERSRPDLSIAVWFFSPRLLVSEIDGGPLRPPPPPAEGRGRTRPSRARVNVSQLVAYFDLNLLHRILSTDRPCRCDANFCTIMKL